MFFTKTWLRRYNMLHHVITVLVIQISEIIKRSRLQWSGIDPFKNYSTYAYQPIIASQKNLKDYTPFL